MPIINLKIILLVKVFLNSLAIIKKMKLTLQIKSWFYFIIILLNSIYFNINHF